MQAEEWRRHKLAELIALWRQGARAAGLRLLPSDTPIQPLLVGEDAAALALSRALRAEGFLVVAIRPPTVPEGSARLRITLTAAHEPEDVHRLLDAVQRLYPVGCAP